jgi:transcriptional repressor NrdR
VKCPFCGKEEDRVIDSRASASGDVIRRRRECEACSKRFTTYERVEYVLPTVVKKDGRREAFDRKKIVTALSIALNKRPVSSERIEAVADAIERELDGGEQREIPSAAIGERVMKQLRAIDEVGYVRFASVYRSFRDIDEFAAELDRMQGARTDERPSEAVIAREPEPTQTH